MSRYHKIVLEIEFKDEITATNARNITTDLVDTIYLKHLLPKEIRDIVDVASLRASANHIIRDYLAKQEQNK